MKEMTIEQKAKAYDKALKVAHRLYEQGTITESLSYIFPELKESEGEKNIKDLIDELKCSLRAANCQNDACGGGHEKRIALLEWSIAWIEKQKTIDVESLRSWLLKDIAMSLVIFLDENTLGMNMSSMECKDIEHALVSSDWDKIYAYMKKKLEKQGEKPQGKTALEAIKEEKVDNQNCAKHTDKVEPKFKVGDNIIKKHNSDINKFGIFTITDIKNGKYMYNNSIICDISEQNEWELVEKVDFKIGDWITLYGDGPFKILKIEAEQNGILDYLLLVQNGRDTYYNKKYVDENARLWTIQDAKDGDVLAATMCSGRVWIGIFKEYNGSTFSSYCFMNTEGIFHLSTSNHGRGEAIHPATKEQRDLLFQKMREAGYEWDAKKKELKKIEQKLNDKVEPFDEYEGLTDFERTLADICIGWIGKEPSWKEYIKDNADVLLKIAIEKFNSIQDVAFEQKSAWSEVDENFFVNVCSIIDTDRIFMESAKRRCKNWLKSIKERVGCEVN